MPSFTDCNGRCVCDDCERDIDRCICDGAPCVWCGEPYGYCECAIEAFCWQPELAPEHVPSWFWEIIGLTPELFDEESGEVTISTLEGDMIAKPGDFIIKGVKGEVYPCKPDIFAMTYEPAEPTA